MAKGGNNSFAILAILAWKDIDILRGAGLTQKNRPTFAYEHVVHLERGKCGGDRLSLNRTELIT